MEFGRAGFDLKVGLPRRKVEVRFGSLADIETQTLPADCCKKVQAQRIKLFVIRDAAALIAHASLKGLPDGGLTSLWGIKIHRNDGSFRRTLDCIERFLAYRIIAKIKGADIDTYHG